MTEAPREPRGPAPAPQGPHRLPALVGAVVIATACLAGLVLQVVQFTGHIRVFPWAAVLALAFAAATFAFGFWILRRIRPVRAPDPVPSAVAAVWGMTAATGAGIVANGGLSAVWSKLLGLDVTGAWDAALTAPVNEELLKLAGIVLVAVVFPRALRDPVDGFVLGALVGLGFEVSENLVYAFQAVTRAGATDPALAVATTTVVRVGLTGLGSHWAMSAVAGTAVGLLAAARWRPERRRAVLAALLVLLAMGQHWLLDAPLFGEGIAAVLVKVAAVFASTMAVYVLVRRSYRRRMRRALAAEGEAVGMRRSAAVALVTRHGRLRAAQDVARPEQPAVLDRQERMLAAAEDRAALDGT
ncbi:PrsW family intramembrane metalloprotease [Nocardiopsis sp. FIRDI 009]|uniref:PrsW family intramembrane metalloprotease n=1 Tax=Nocardiopsis sp. FIRDI 009 TaxID=714197 RepID=UPI000E229383|nr:PrsW family intramembrane metalloprotease [Nocardiopsis sp. FIRDI 009]